MEFKRILITGGAGFVGSNLALHFKNYNENLQINVCDNLKRRGSELNLPRLKAKGIDFFHADIRCQEDFEDLPSFDLMIDCSAEPSVQAGISGSPMYVINTNLGGTINCFELARKNNAAIIFLSTSRVYPLQAIENIEYEERESRFEWVQSQKCHGYSPMGISEEFTLEGARSMYGASKLASEFILQEYIFNYNLKGIINRCGLVTGPWQMGKVDQGVVALWVARHVFGGNLKYIGYEGKGKQVRDILHIDDLFELLLAQIRDVEKWTGNVYNVGGGRDISVSLLELTQLCREVTNKEISISSIPQTSPVDLRIYLTDTSRVQRDFNWSPKKNPGQIIEDIFNWMKNNQAILEPFFT